MGETINWIVAANQLNTCSLGTSWHLALPHTSGLVLFPEHLQNFDRKKRFVCPVIIWFRWQKLPRIRSALLPCRVFRNAADGSGTLPKLRSTSGGKRTGLMMPHVHEFCVCAVRLCVWHAGSTRSYDIQIPSYISISKRVWKCFFFPFCVFGEFHVLSMFLAVCSILQLEWAGSCHFNGICNIVRTSHFLWYCNSLVLFTAFWSWKLPFINDICSIFEFELFIFHGICNMLVLELFM